MWNNVRVIVMRTILIVVAAGVVGFTVNRLSPVGIRFTAQEKHDSGQTGIHEMSLEDAYAHFQSEEGIFLDARHETSFRQRHIPRAINIYFKNAEQNPKLQAMDREAMYIVYCKGPHCDFANRLASSMFTMGFKNIYVYSGGMQEWLAENYPTESL